MKRLILFVASCMMVLNVWAAPGEMPDAVCGNGEVTGNTHCVTRASISSIPMPALASSPICIAIIVLSGVILWRMKR